MSLPNTPEQRGLLNDASPAPTASPATPLFSAAARHRPGYTRVPSVSFNDSPQTRDITDTLADDEITPAPAHSQGAGRNHGLGIISEGSKKSEPAVLPATPPQEASSNVRKTPDQNYTPYSPPSTGAMTGSTKFEESFDLSYNPKHKDSRISLQSGAASTYAQSDAGLISVRSAYNNEDFEPHQHCQSKKAHKHGRLTNWISITILILAVFSTVFSAIFLIIAISQPQYGRAIRQQGGKLTPSSAAFLTSFFAKLIELSFVTIIVAFIGQALARRAFKLEHARGVTLAELSMRAWVLQPGTMLTQWESVRYAGVTFLGVVSFLAAILAILYTSAATALVQPQLVIPDSQSKSMLGLVKTQYANPVYIADNCKTPVKPNYDKAFVTEALDNSGTTCLQIDHAANAFHNFHNFLATWTDAARSFGNSTKNLDTRPKGYALYNDNTTIIAPWIAITNITHQNEHDFPGYIINNVTMAMPHIGVVQAAIDPLNDIMQPYEVDGATYSIRASVPSPMVNVLCVTLNETQMEPFVYQQWDDRNKTACNETDWVTNGAWPACLSYPNGTDLYLMYGNGTGIPAELNRIFQWGKEYGLAKYPPVFPLLSTNYNTVINETRGIATWGATAMYILLKGGPTNYQGTAMGDTNYGLCQLQAGQTPHCATHYNASSSGATMEAVCDTDDPLQFNRSVPAAPSGPITYSADWPNIAAEWARSLSLNAGLYAGNASNARLLSQFVVTEPKLSAALPSTAEALAVLAGNTLIQSSKDAPFYMFWNYTDTTIAGDHQDFNASIRVQQYASGGSQGYQKLFYVILVAVFVMNVAILLYFIWHRDWYTDFSEPVHLFALAVNSPPSQELAGSCGCGPSGEQYKTSWKMHKYGDHFYVDSQGPNENVMNVDSPRFSRRRFTQTFEMDSPVGRLKNRFSRQL